MGSPKHMQAAGGVLTRSYKAWMNMKSRCQNPHNISFPNYGGRGITVCAEWQTFEGFFRDMGACAEGYSIDRIDSNKSYCKDNCRWILRCMQSRNRRGVFATIEIARQVLARRADGSSYSELANEFWLHKATIGAIVTNRQWKEYAQ